MRSFTGLCLLVASVSAWAETRPVSGKEFCKRLEPVAHATDGRSLGHVREALGLAKGALGDSAKNSVEGFKKAEFIDLAAEDPEWRDRSTIDEEDVPLGAIFVLEETKKGTCPVASDTGHVAVKCRKNELVWFSDEKTPMTVTRLVRKYPKCIKAIMIHPEWDDDDGPPAKKGAQKAKPVAIRSV